MKPLIFMALLLTFFTTFSQSTELPKTISAFVDCSNIGECYDNYVRQELPTINFVRDRLDADVHIVVTAQSNSTGVRQYYLHFIGRNTFTRLQDTIQYSVLPTSTENESRELFVTHLKMGLIPYLSKTTQAEKITITFPEVTKENTTKEKDPWNAWVFQTSANGYMNGSENYSSGSIYVNLSADRETEKSKSNIFLNNSERFEKFKNGSSVYRYKFLAHHAGAEYGLRLNQHWALGGLSDWTNSLFSNYKSQFSGGLKTEYSIFPFKEFNTRKWVCDYAIGANYNKYYDTTIYLKSKELLFEQSISSNFSYIQAWGSANVGVYWSNYLNDFKKNNLSLNGGVELKVVKGLNVSLYGNYSFVHNQINIRKGDIDLDQLLVQNKELLSSYNYYLSAGISYRFGSKFNNAVNPAFR